MPRSHGRVLCSIWNDEDFIALGPETQRAYFLLISQPDLSHAGVLPWVPSRWGRLAAGSSTGSIEKAIGKLEAARFVVIDRETSELLIRTLVVHDGGLANPKMRGAIRSALAAIHSPMLRVAVLEVIPEEYRDDIARVIPIRSPSDRNRTGDPKASRSNAEVGGKGRGGSSSSRAASTQRPQKRTTKRSEKKATRPPRDFMPDAALLEWAAQKAPGIDVARETEKWLDYCEANGKAYKDHRAAWRTWMSNAVDFARGPANGNGNGHRNGHGPTRPRLGTAWVCKIGNDGCDNGRISTPSGLEPCECIGGVKR